MAYTNAQKLAAIINVWASPLVDQLVSANMASIPSIGMLENKIRSTGWVSPRWSLAAELSPLVHNVSSAAIEPIIANYLGNMPDASIPSIAHGVVDNALQSPDGLALFEGRISFDKQDLTRLKRLLNINLPLDASRGYEVLTNDPIKPSVRQKQNPTIQNENEND